METRRARAVQEGDGAQPPGAGAGRGGSDADEDDNDDDSGDDAAPGPTSTAARRDEALRGTATAAVIRPSKQVPVRGHAGACSALPAL
jgi:hypothetical protein